MTRWPRSSVLDGAALVRPWAAFSRLAARRSTALTRSTSRRCENGLVMKSSAPILSPKSSSISSSFEVRKITGRSDFWRRRRRSSIPSMRGILISKIASCGGRAARPSSADAPSVYVSTRYPSASRAIDTEVRILRSSSTSAMVCICSNSVIFRLTSWTRPTRPRTGTIMPLRKAATCVHEDKLGTKCGTVLRKCHSTINQTSIPTIASIRKRIVN